ncbi:MAG TPA: ABC transporter substrate-binding protein [Spirochaetia bacterium]|nr:ABC transporter substrate-binding protein [Spirochaetia bacterium]
MREQMRETFTAFIKWITRPRGGASRMTGLVLLLMTAALPLAHAQQLDPVKLAIAYIPNIQFTPLYVGIEKGYYRDAGVDLKIEYGFGMDIYSLLLAGKIDVGLADSDQLIIAGSKGLALAAAFQYYERYPVTIVARKGVVDTPADFAGKTIGVPELFGTSYIGLQLFLEHYNLKDKVKVEKIGYTQIPALLSDKIAGAVVFVTNEPVKLRQMNVPINAWDVMNFSNLVSSSFISSKADLKNRADVLERFFEATKRAMEYTAGHIDESVTIAMKYINGANESQRPFLTSALRTTADLWNSPKGYGYIDTARYQESIRTMTAMGLIPSVYAAESIVNPLAQQP